MKSLSLRLSFHHLNRRDFFFPFRFRVPVVRFSPTIPSLPSKDEVDSILSSGDLFGAGSTCTGKSDSGTGR